MVEWTSWDSQSVPINLIEVLVDSRASRGYYAVGLPILALFALGAKRLPIFLGTIAYIVLVAVLILPLRGKFVRNLVNL